MSSIPCSDVASEALYLRSCIGVERKTQYEHMADASARLDPADFAFDVHARIAALLWERTDAKQAVWKHELKKAAPQLADDLDRILADPGEREQLALPIAEHLRALARRRRKYETLQRALSALERGDEEVATEHVFSVSTEATELAGETAITAADVVEGALRESLSAKQTDYRRTGFPLLDTAIGSLRAQTMTIIGGTTGSGKSSLMLAMAMNQAMRNVPVGIVSCEDSPAVWGPRVLSHVAEVNPEQWEEKRTEFFEHQTEMGIVTLQDFPLHFKFELNKPLRDVLRAIRHLVTARKVQVVYVDYLQAIADDGRRERRLFIGGAAARIKAQCQELGVSLVLGSQLSRPSSQSPFGEVYTTQLKEAGEIENAAEGVILLWKDGDGDDAKTLGKVAKVKWTPRRPRFEMKRHPRTGCVIGLDAPEKTEEQRVVRNIRGRRFDAG